MTEINHKKNAIKGVVYLLTSAFLYSIMPLLIRLLGAEKIPPMSQVFLRYIFAFISAFIYFFILSRSRFIVHKKDTLLILLISIFGYALTNLFFTYSILNTQVGNALFLFYSYGVITPILGIFFLKERVGLFKSLAIIISVMGLLLLFQPNSFPTWKIGGLFAILSAFGQSFYLIWRKKLNLYSGSILMLINTFVGVIILGTLSLMFESSFYTQSGIMQISINTWIVTILFGFDNFLSWLFMTKGFELFQGSTGSMILLLENVFGILFALLFFQEIPTAFTIGGGFLILVSSIMIILHNK